MSPVKIFSHSSSALKEVHANPFQLVKIKTGFAEKNFDEALKMAAWKWTTKL